MLGTTSFAIFLTAFSSGSAFSNRRNFKTQEDSGLDKNRNGWRGQLQYKIRYSLAEVTFYCLPSLPCRCPCEYGIEYPSRCGMCVCPSCGACSSACYYKVRPGEACPRCAPSQYCFGESANWQEKPRYPSQHVTANPKEPEKPKPSKKPQEPHEKPNHPDGPKDPEKPKPSKKPNHPDGTKEPQKPKTSKKPSHPDGTKEPQKPKPPKKPKEPEKPKPPKKPNNKVEAAEESDMPLEPENPMNLETPEEPRSLKSPEKPIEKPKEPEKPH
ncbi:hypothetical protein MTO96_002866 [Rhipicephalus appendiculatus]